MYKVNEVAKLSGVSVRTLHHYDRTGLLKPETLSPAGYRLYGQNGLERLQQILFFKEPDFSLRDIKHLIGSPMRQKKKLLQTQRQLLMEKKMRLTGIIRTLDRSLKGDKPMEAGELFSAFNDEVFKMHKQAYAEEARQLYGHSDAYKESQNKTKNYSKQDRNNITDEGTAVYRQIAAHMDKKPAHRTVQALVKRWQDHISRHYYKCTKEILGGPGELYVNDPRFTKNIDKIKPGLAAFLSRAIAHYCKK